MRGAECLSSLGHHREAVSWADRGLEQEQGHAGLEKLREASQARAKELERDARKKEAMERKQKTETAALLEEVRRRGVQVAKGLSLDSLEPSHPSALTVRRGGGAGVPDCHSGQTRGGVPDLASLVPLS